MTEVIRFLIQNGAKVKTLKNINISDIKDVIIPNHTFVELDTKEIEELLQEDNKEALKIIFDTTPSLLGKEDVVKIAVKYWCLELLFPEKQTQSNDYEIFDLKE